MGHLLNALYVWGAARHYRTQIELRIEDHDFGRCREEYIDSILRDLEWFRLFPSTSIEKKGLWRQNERNERYKEAFAQLLAEKRAYGCCCSRKELAERLPSTPHQELRYDGVCREKGFPCDSEHLWRVRLEPRRFSFKDLLLGEQTQEPWKQCGDLVIRDRLGYWSYQFCVTVDDIDQEIDLIIRGEDLLESSGRQLQLREMLGEKRVPCFAHHPLLFDKEGKKLSKREFSTSLGERREAGATAEQLFGEALGLPPLSLDEALEQISLRFGERELIDH